MIIWEGMELLYYSRKYKLFSPVRGAVYVVKGWDERIVFLELHPDYVGKKVTADAPAPADAAAENDEDGEDGEDGEESDPEELEVLDEAPQQPNPAEKREGDLYMLPKKRFSEIMRPQFALVYASVQGRTFRQKHIGLMNLDRFDFLGVRDIIVAMPRPTHGKFLHFLTHGEEAAFMKQSHEVNGDALKKLAAKIRGEPAGAPEPQPDCS
jgi:hypothetical protein